MGLRDRVKRSLRSVMDRFSGEYSAAATEIRPDAPAAADQAGAEVKVTRARLRRPKDAREPRDG